MRAKHLFINPSSHGGVIYCLISQECSSLSSSPHLRHPHERTAASHSQLVVTQRPALLLTGLRVGSNPAPAPPLEVPLSQHLHLIPWEPRPSRAMLRLRDGNKPGHGGSEEVRADAGGDWAWLGYINIQAPD